MNFSIVPILLSAIIFPVYDIPLSEDLQRYTHQICTEYQISPELAFAVMEQESRYEVDIISSTNDYGLMQINKGNHEWLSEVLDIDDFLDPKQNILAGIYILSILKHDSIHFTLTAYNMGKGKANNMFKNGIYASKYSREVMDKYWRF